MFTILEVMQNNLQDLSGGDGRTALHGELPTGIHARAAALVARWVVQRAAVLAGISVVEVQHTQQPAPGTSELRADVILVRPGVFYARLGVRGLIGLGESYVAGDWEAPHPQRDADKALPQDHHTGPTVDAVLPEAVPVATSDLTDEHHRRREAECQCPL
ncbi:hypothetical protein [Corynebacterium sp.]|uniref:hypothetical protein n=2 Tax=Corynebacterium sp. TaxID=1720 RepID=UPI00264723B6|nr:hypothetical protein [Corynebacterium sp.]MDN6368798.1 hypothetical protein [Corynebacterium sp.]